jgi:isoquinoline 1-oxidoreductase alpha subunit
MTSFTVNGIPHRHEGAPEMPLLWFLRDIAELNGTKFGCGVGACGACTVHVNGRAVRSCVIRTATLEGAAVVTIEGLTAPLGEHVKRAWVETEVPQCGYCQPGMIMAAAALLAQDAAPSDATIDQKITNVCRCGTYNRIRRAIHAAAGSQA